MGQRFFGFEKLDIYHLSVEMAAEVYRISAAFPADERFGLTNQLRRAATSITLNIAEGSGRDSRKDFAHFLMQARGSAYEVASALDLAVRLGYLTPEQPQEVLVQAHTLCAKITALARNLKAAP
ncbi:four helix bundle protein [Deinococcus multiflagellatus]|uniref:Four helix bundle protein n=1 Tax=Deinococcus multiflagellatus TaxID=1656887 RepID=A0ABW1ZHQ0_9DEIO|nr:four helix bundle protein [Deinococcus multiflagellatus]MBZ9713082.1 four helix bundle protein [Deinococcus multiflagellatus]